MVKQEPSKDKIPVLRTPNKGTAKKYLKVPPNTDKCLCGHTQDDFTNPDSVCYKGNPKEVHPKKEKS